MNLKENQMNIETWKKYIDDNICSDKLEVLYKLVSTRNVKYDEFKILLKYIKEI